MCAGLPFLDMLMVTAVVVGLTLESSRKASLVGVFPLISIVSATGDNRFGETLGEVLGEISGAVLTTGDDSVGDFSAALAIVRGWILFRNMGWFIRDM